MKKQLKESKKNADLNITSGNSITTARKAWQILSNYGFKSKWTNWMRTRIYDNSGIMLVNIEVNGKELSFMNVHLDCGSSTNRETEIIKGMNYMDIQTAEYKILLEILTPARNQKCTDS